MYSILTSILSLFIETVPASASTLVSERIEKFVPDYERRSGDMIALRRDDGCRWVFMHKA